MRSTDQSSNPNDGDDPAPEKRPRAGNPAAHVLSYVERVRTLLDQARGRRLTVEEQEVLAELRAALGTLLRDIGDA